VNVEEFVTVSGQGSVNNTDRFRDLTRTKCNSDDCIKGAAVLTAASLSISTKSVWIQA
jgi:hypothetical protein